MSFQVCANTSDLLDKFQLAYDRTQLDEACPSWLTRLLSTEPAGSIGLDIIIHLAEQLPTVAAAGAPGANVWVTADTSPSETGPARRHCAKELRLAMALCPCDFACFGAGERLKNPSWLISTGRVLSHQCSGSRRQGCPGSWPFLPACTSHRRA